MEIRIGRARRNGDAPFRRRTVQAIPGAKVETVANGGHFLSLDQPERLAELIKSFTGAQASQTTKLGPDDRV
jgi:pimeloyl-ACP methyl ester carboxylesterase